MKQQYTKRLMDDILKRELDAFGAVLINGPKWCGKTTTARQQANSVLYMQDPANQENYLQLADLNPALLLQGEKPRLLDEWQMTPQIWDAIRFDIDKKNLTGQYILTGSTSVDESKIKHSGAGRIYRIRMHTMSLFESQDSNGEVSLSEIFSGKTNFHSESHKTIEDYARLIVRGGWPASLGKSDEIARRQVAGYCETISASDINTVDGVQRDPERTKALLRSYSRNIATQATKGTFLEDLTAGGRSFHVNTLDSYLEALNRLYVVDDIPAWSPFLRSKTAIRTSSKRQLADPAIAAYFLGATPNDLLFDVNTFGFLFESMALRDLRIYAQSLDGNLYHYRDRNGLEVDAIIHLPNGKWAGIEVKLGLKMVDEAAENLIKLRDQIDSGKMPSSSFLMVITGGKYAYIRKDGVLVVPLACLKS
ncbi:MAG: ATP-binding protein [Anaerolineaceae bacterium]|jgi:predicted AAA+ superfamily ATPase